MRRLLSMLFVSLVVFSFSSCATIVGGAKYNARVQVPDHPNAKISINGQYRGTGETNAMINRKEANQLSVTVQDGNDEPQTTYFTGRKFRAGTLICNLLFGWLPPVPAGVIVDACTGAWWKPDENEDGVTKIDGKNYLYTIKYQPTSSSATISSGTQPQPQAPVPTTATDLDTIKNTPASPEVQPVKTLTRAKTEALRELKQLLDEGILTKEEFDKEKAKLLQAD